MPTAVRAATDKTSAMFSQGDASGDKAKSEEGSNPKNANNARRDYVHEFFFKAECPYSHNIFKRAAQIYDCLKHDSEEDEQERSYRRVRAVVVNGTTSKSTDPHLDISQLDLNFESENDKRLAFNLVFATLKYQRFLEKMLDDCVFFRVYSEFKDDEAIVVVMLCDFQQRKFQCRTPLPGETLDPFLTEIEQALYSCRTKLNAGLARSRITARVRSVEQLLPGGGRTKELGTAQMHLCCWVNAFKSNRNTVTDRLRDEGFIEVCQEQNLVGRTYMLDSQCGDVIAFPGETQLIIEEHDLVREAHLVVQDKSSCVGAQSVRYLINEGDDILHVNVGSGLTTAHLASLAHGTGSTVHAFSQMSEMEHAWAVNTLERIGAQDRVRLYNESILHVEPGDERLRHLKVALLAVSCSRSAVANPVNFICSEGEDVSILRHLSMGGEDTRVSELVVQHNTLLKHVMKFPRMQGIVYCTRSLQEIENEGVVTRAIEYVNAWQPKNKTPFRICPPVVPLSDRDIENENPLNGKYLRYPPSRLMSGCFVATITREADDPKAAAKEILARAAAKGILTGVPVSMTEEKKSSKKKGKKAKRSGRNVSPRRNKSDAETSADAASVSALNSEFAFGTTFTHPSSPVLASHQHSMSKTQHGLSNQSTSVLPGYSTNPVSSVNSNFTPTSSSCPTAGNVNYSTGSKEFAPGKQIKQIKPSTEMFTQASSVSGPSIMTSHNAPVHGRNMYGNDTLYNGGASSNVPVYANNVSNGLAHGSLRDASPMNNRSSGGLANLSPGGTRKIYTQSQTDNGTSRAEALLQYFEQDSHLLTLSSPTGRPKGALPPSPGSSPTIRHEREPPPHRKVIQHPMPFRKKARRKAKEQPEKM